MKKHIFASLLVLMVGSASAQSLQVGSNGNVGVGTSTPSEKLEVVGNLKVNSAVLAPSGNAPMFAARAWVNFNGTGAIGADQTIRASGNVSRVYKTTNGTYTIYFSTAMEDANMCVVANSYDTSSGSSGKVVSINSITATEVQIQVRGTGGSVYNSEIVTVAFFR